MSPTYPRPDTSDDYRADARECMDRAQRALEVAEVNLDTVSEMFSRSCSFADLIAHAEARTRLGRAWSLLSEAKWGAE